VRGTTAAAEAGMQRPGGYAAGTAVDVATAAAAAEMQETAAAESAKGAAVGVAAVGLTTSKPQ